MKGGSHVNGRREERENITGIRTTVRQEQTIKKM